MNFALQAAGLQPAFAPRGGESDPKRLIGDAFFRRKTNKSNSGKVLWHRSEDSAALPERMLDGLTRFNGRVLLILSGDDYTAKEFSDLVNASGKWQKLLGASRVSRRDLPEADHTFSRREWRDQVANWTTGWIHEW